MARSPRIWWISAAVVAVLVVAGIATATSGFGLAGGGGGGGGGGLAGGGSSGGATVQGTVGGGAPGGGASQGAGQGGARAGGGTSGRLVSARDAGAAGDGRTDDTAALQHALDGLSEGDGLELPAGATFAHSGVLHIRTAGITVTGGGTLLATDEQQSAVEVAADRVTLSGITVATADTTRRWSAPQQTGVWLDEHSDVTLTDVTVEGSASAGVFVQGTQHFTLTRVTVRDTRADGIHMTDGARYGVVTDALTENTGDDGVAVVAYVDDDAQARDIEIVSPHVHGNTHGRGVSVVGGADVQITGIDVRDTAAAGIYIACERGQFQTHVPSQVTVSGGTVDGANQDPTVDHGAVLVYNQQGDEAIRDVTVQNLTISDTRASASRQVGLISDNGGQLLGITLTDLRFTGTGPSRLLGTNTDQLQYRASGWTRDGRAVSE